MNRFRFWLLPAVFICGWWAARRLAPDGATEPAQGGTEDAVADSAAVLREEVLRLRRMLESEREGRDARELEMLEFAQAMALLDVAAAPPAPEFLKFERKKTPPASSDATGADSEIEAAPDPATERGQILRRDLMALLLGERMQSLEILEVGRPADGSTGPVVVRLLDERGRPTGTLACERLRLECSRSARSITLVFEEGYERYGNQVLMFGMPTDLADVTANATSVRRTGTRRIDLAHVDPQPWIDLLPELFQPEDLEALPDDGRWDRVLVLRELNRMLSATTRGGRWRMRELGGVVDDTLREVHLVQMDEHDRPIQRIFADRLRIESGGTGILLLLRDGVSERDGRRAPFLDGRYRIFLPAAPIADWLDADLPHGFDTQNGTAVEGEVKPSPGSARLTRAVPGPI